MDPAHARELLSRERARIETALGDFDRRERSDDPDPFEAADAGGELLEAEIGEGLTARLKDELAAIERAERRLAEGNFGLSIDSGEPIPDARLESVPWAERTAAEQGRYESLGR